MRMESKGTSLSEERLYWLQIVITVIFGIMAYYILESIFPYGIPDTVFLHIASLWIVSAIYFLLLVGIPLSILMLKYGEKLGQGVKKSLKSFGTQLSLFVLVAGITYLLNM